MIQLGQCLLSVLAVVVIIVSGLISFVKVLIKVIQEDAVSIAHSHCFASGEHANYESD